MVKDATRIYFQVGQSVVLINGTHGFTLDPAGLMRRIFTLKSSARLLLIFSVLSFGALAQAQEDIHAQVILIVDTSISMDLPDMDPHMGSLLVTRLFSDIVPGDLAVARLVMVSKDNLPHAETGRKQPCNDNPANLCSVVQLGQDADEFIRNNASGILMRPLQGDTDFKEKLESHLRRESVNSSFSLSFIAASGVIERWARGKQAGVERVVLWLSDGKTDVSDVEKLEYVIRQLRKGGVRIEALVFGGGDTSLAENKLGLETRRVTAPADMMHAVAGSFRRIVGAPYDLDGRVADRPTFQMEEDISEAWVVVYGDASLQRVNLDGPKGRVSADFATDSWPTAAAYRVAHIKNPEPGKWRIRASGGGAGLAYAVVQRSGLRPVYLGPTEAFAGGETQVLAEFQLGTTGARADDPQLLRDIELSLEWDGHKTILKTDFQVGATVLGLYGGMVEFDRSGDIVAKLCARGRLLERCVPVNIEVGGEFFPIGEHPRLDLGNLGLSDHRCVAAPLSVQHRGIVPLALKTLSSLPLGHVLYLRLDGSRIDVDAGPVSLSPGGRYEVCLDTTDLAAISRSEHRDWLTLGLPGAADDRMVVFNLSWKVEGLAWWQRWLWLILLMAGVLLVLIIVAGYVLPQRLPRGLGVVFGEERDDVMEMSPIAVLQFRGTGVHFYRNARACLHSDYRITGRESGAAAVLRAGSARLKVTPGVGLELYREGYDGDWEQVSKTGVVGQSGDIYRMGPRGPFFRIQMGMY